MTAKKAARGKSSGAMGKAAQRRTARRASARRAEETKTSDPYTLNGIPVITPDGEVPGIKGAQGYVEGSRIKPLKFIQALRSGGIGDISELRKLIKRDGIIEPLVVRPAGDGENFELIAGERRLTSAKGISRIWNRIPVIIRMDLQGNDDRAVAVAIAENAEEGRTNLNVVDIGEQCARLKKKGWSTERMSKEMGLHIKKIRRALEITEIPTSVQERVREGEVSLKAALELKKLPPDMQKKIESQIGPGTTEPEIRRMRKQLEREQEAEKAAKGESVGRKRQKTGEDSTAPKIGSWQKPSEKTLQIGQMCHALSESDDEEVGSTNWHELRGAIGYALWDRGDLDDPFLPSIYEDEMVEPEIDKKLNAIFVGIVENEAARHEARLKRR